MKDDPVGMWGVSRQISRARYVARLYYTLFRLRRIFSYVGSISRERVVREYSFLLEVFESIHMILERDELIEEVSSQKK